MVHIYLYTTYYPSLPPQIFYDSTGSACRSPPARPTLGHVPFRKTYSTALEVQLLVLRRLCATFSRPRSSRQTPGPIGKVQSYCRQKFALVMI